MRFIRTRSYGSSARGPIALLFSPSLSSSSSSVPLCLSVAPFARRTVAGKVQRRFDDGADDNAADKDARVRDRGHV